MSTPEVGFESHRRRGVLPPKALLISLIAQIPLTLWLSPLEPSRQSVVTGVLMLVAGAGLNIRAERLFRRNQVGVCPFSPVPTLVRTGPFRFTRNPMYLGMVMISGFPAVLADVHLNLWAAAALALWLHFRFVLPEEQYLEQRLGVAYLAYACRVPRWLGLPAPRLPGTDLPAAGQGN